MQMSTWDPDACHYEVLIDGEKVPFCAYANEEKGVALLYVTVPYTPSYANYTSVQVARSVSVTDENENRLLVERRGHIEIRKQDHPDKIFDTARAKLTRQEGTQNATGEYLNIQS